MSTPTDSDSADTTRSYGAASPDSTQPYRTTTDSTDSTESVADVGDPRFSGSPDRPASTNATAGSPPVWSAATAPQHPGSRGPRAGTIVLGLVLVLCGLAAGAVALGYTLDLQLGLIILLAIAGLGLLAVPLLSRGRAGR